MVITLRPAIFLRTVIYIVTLFAAIFPVTAKINAVYVCNAGEPVPVKPVNGHAAWNEFVRIHPQLSFAAGYTYHLKVEYTSVAAGTILTDGLAGIATVGRVTFDAATQSYEFDLTIGPQAQRLDTFRFGFTRGTGGMTDAVSCKVVRIGQLYSMLVCDTSGTTTAVLEDSAKGWISTLTLRHGSGVKQLHFLGEGLSHVQVDTATVNAETAGLTFLPLIPPAFDTCISFAIRVSELVQPKYGLLRTQVLNRIMDEAADPACTWVSYTFARFMPDRDVPISEGVSGSPVFEVVPGRYRKPDTQCTGFHHFYNTSFRVE